MSRPRNDLHKQERRQHYENIQYNHYNLKLSNVKNNAIMINKRIPKLFLKFGLIRWAITWITSEMMNQAK